MENTALPCVTIATISQQSIHTSMVYALHTTHRHAIGTVQGHMSAQQPPNTLTMVTFSMPAVTWREMDCLQRI